MKRIYQKLVLFLLLAVTTLTITGCATTDAYRLSQTRNDVDFAMTRYQNRVAFGAVSSAMQSQVTSVYQAYKSAFDAAVQQAHSNYDAPTPDNVKQLADQVLSTLASIPAVP